MLQKAQETASTADSKMFGVEVGIVTNVKDDQKLGRIKVCFPRLPGKPESDWVRVAQPSAGPDRGFYWLPHVNDEVLQRRAHFEAARRRPEGRLENPLAGARHPRIHADRGRAGRRSRPRV